MPRPPFTALGVALLVGACLHFIRTPALADPGIPVLTDLRHATRSTQLSWQGGHGPYTVETSEDLLRWSDQGDPESGTGATVAAFGTERFHRIRDLDPDGELGPSFGLLQTEQSEFGRLFAKHRLKTRLWLFRSDEAVHTTAPFQPGPYWRRLIVHLQQRDDGVVRTWTGRLGDLGLVETPTARRMTVTWVRGSGAGRRTHVLSVDFPYDHAAPRATAPFASDPTWTLDCRYASPQPEWEGPGTTPSTTLTDSVRLIELAPTDPASPDHRFRVRRYDVRRNGVAISLHFYEGLPLYEGEIPWILKTFPLDRWMAPTTGGGGTLPAFSVDSYFARTVMPGHHNFYEVVLIEPALDPALSRETREALTAANIHQIYTFKDLAGVTIGGNGEDIRYIGFDGSIRLP